MEVPGRAAVWVNVILYALLAGGAIWCWFARARSHMGPRPSPGGEGALWATMAAFFVALAVMRGLGIDECLRAMLRDRLIADGAWAGRRALQTPVVLALLAFGAVVGGWLVTRAGRWSRPALLARLSMLGFIFAYALRIISLHATDRILYGDIGPFRLNYALELALVGLGAAAILTAARPPNSLNRAAKSVRTRPSQGER